MSNIELTIKQEKFCQKYLECDGNASEAYRQSYNCENSGEATINQEAYLLTQNPDITLRIEELKALRLKRHQITVDRVVAGLGTLAFFDMRKAFYPDGTLKPINELDDETATAIIGLETEEKKITSDEEVDDPIAIVRIRKIKLADRKGALDSLAKHLGIMTDNVNVNLGNKPDEVFVVESPDAIVAAATYNELLEKIGK